MYSILVVEDNEAFRSLLVKVLKEEGYRVDDVDNPILALEKFVLNQYDLVITDYQMDLMNGTRLLKSIKNINPKIKTIILTGEAGEHIEIEAMDVEADYFIEKRKSLDIVLKYIERVLALPSSKEGRLKTKELISKTENIRMDLDSLIVRKDEKEISLSSKEWALLKFFLENKSVALSREQIVETIWHSDIEHVDERTVDSHIKNLRKKLQSFSIVTIRNYGYRWNEE